MRPKPPRSNLAAADHPLEWYVFWLLVLAATVWEAGWVVLSLAGADPRGQLPQAFFRVLGAGRLAITSHVIPGGWGHVLWDSARPVSLVAVVLVAVGLLLAGTMVLRLVRRALGWGSPRSPRSAGGGPAGGQPAATLDKSLDEWLAGVAAGEDHQ